MNNYDPTYCPAPEPPPPSGCGSLGRIDTGTITITQYDYMGCVVERVTYSEANPMPPELRDALARMVGLQPLPEPPKG